MRTLLLFLLLASGIHVKASTSDLFLDIQSDLNQDKESYSTLIDKHLSQSQENNIEKGLLIYYSIEDNGLEQYVINKILENLESCREKEIINSLYTPKNGLTISEINSSHNKKINNLKNCEELDDSDKIFIYSNILGSEFEVEELWIGSLKELEELSLNIKENNILVSPRAASNLYFTISIRGLKACQHFGNPNCSLIEKFFPDLKLAHYRLLYENENFFDKDIFYAMQMQIINDINNKEISNYFSSNM